MLPSLLAVFAHPDDEALVAGGVLAQHTGAPDRIISTEYYTRVDLTPSQVALERLTT